MRRDKIATHLIISDRIREALKFSSILQAYLQFPHLEICDSSAYLRGRQYSKCHEKTEANNVFISLHISIVSNFPTLSVRLGSKSITSYWRLRSYTLLTPNEIDVVCLTQLPIYTCSRHCAALAFISWVIFWPPG